MLKKIDYVFLFKIMYLIFVVLGTIPFVSQYSVKYFKFLLPVGAAILLFLFFKSKQLQKNKYFILITLFVVCVFLSICINFKNGIINNIKGLCYLILQIFLITYFNLDNLKVKHQMNILNNLIIIFITFISCVSFSLFLYKLNGSYTIWNSRESVNEINYYGIAFENRLTGITSNPNTLGIIAVIAICSIFILISQNKFSKLLKFFYYSAAIINFVCFIMSGSRGAEIAGIVFFIVYLYFVFTAKTEERSNPVIKKCVACLLACVIPVVGWLTFPTLRNWIGYLPALVQREQVTSDFSDDHSGTTFIKSMEKGHVNLQRDTKEETFGNGRFYLWKAGIKTVLKYPIFGVGKDQLAQHVAEINPNTPLPGIKGGGMHNIFLQTIVAYGFLSFAALLLLATFLIKDSWKIMFGKVVLPERGVCAAILASIAMMLANNMVEANILYSTSFMNFYFVLNLGFLMYYLNTSENKKCKEIYNGDYNDQKYLDCISEKEKIQNKIFEIVLQVDKICRNNNIQYYICDGSCLGAIRHGGFIPWDDDFDIAMTRSNYIKFKEACLRELKSPFFYQDSETDPNYPLVFAKIRNSNTTFIEKNLETINMNHGIYVDIFPIDGVPNSFIKKIIQKYIFLFIRKSKEHVYPEKFLKKILFKLSEFILFKLFDKEKLLNVFFNYATSFSTDNMTIWTYFLGRFDYKKSTIEKTIFGIPSEIIFCEKKLLTVENTSRYLTHVYGDYMTPPPFETIIKQAHATVFDCNKSYKEYFNG